jgi:protein-L-isoaspartate(D-aspartate) O-methyltransferase
MDIEQARFNMVEQQIRTWEVLDQSVLDLLLAVHREAFVPEKYRALAFVDMEIPLGHGEVMLAPKMEARMLQELAVKANERVLEVGTGSGYFTALLARRAASVTSVEIVPELAAFGRANLAANGISNVELHVGDAARGWPVGGAYDVIALTGSVRDAPQALIAQLKPGGRLIAVVGSAPIMRATLYTATGQGTHVRVVFDTVIPPLRDAALKPQFVF